MIKENFSDDLTPAKPVAFVHMVGSNDDGITVTSHIDPAGIGRVKVGMISQYTINHLYWPAVDHTYAVKSQVAGLFNGQREVQRLPVDPTITVPGHVAKSLAGADKPANRAQRRHAYNPDENARASVDEQVRKLVRAKETDGVTIKAKPTQQIKHDDRRGYTWGYGTWDDFGEVDFPEQNPSQAAGKAVKGALNSFADVADGLQRMSLQIETFTAALNSLNSFNPDHWQRYELSLNFAVKPIGKRQRAQNAFVRQFEEYVDTTRVQLAALTEIVDLDGYRPATLPMSNHSSGAAVDVDISPSWVRNSGTWGVSGPALRVETPIERAKRITREDFMARTAVDHFRKAYFHT